MEIIYIFFIESTQTNEQFGWQWDDIDEKARILQHGATAQKKEPSAKGCRRIIRWESRARYRLPLSIRKKVKQYNHLSWNLTQTCKRRGLLNCNMDDKTGVKFSLTKNDLIQVRKEKKVELLKETNQLLINTRFWATYMYLDLCKKQTELLIDGYTTEVQRLQCIVWKIARNSPFLVFLTKAEFCEKRRKVGRRWMHWRRLLITPTLFKKKDKLYNSSS